MNRLELLKQYRESGGKGTYVGLMKEVRKMEFGGDINKSKPDKPPFNEWYKTIPEDKNDTLNYRLRYGYENNLIPQEQLNAFVNNKDAHLMSAYKNPNTGDYEFLKSKQHPTVNLELDWYNSNKAKRFKRDYELYDDGTDYYQYKRKQ